jgi:hypothetical protein
MKRPNEDLPPWLETLMHLFFMVLTVGILLLLGAAVGRSC